MRARHSGWLHTLLGTPSSRLLRDPPPRAHLLPLGSCHSLQRASHLILLCACSRAALREEAGASCTPLAPGAEVLPGATGHGSRLRGAGATCSVCGHQHEMDAASRAHRGLRTPQFHLAAPHLPFPGWSKGNELTFGILTFCYMDQHHLQLPQTLAH